jgi:predicted transcriptional regulator
MNFRLYYIVKAFNSVAPAALIVNEFYKRGGDSMTSEMIRFIRQTRGLTLREFAAAVGCSYTYISLIESGGWRVTPRLERKIRQAFDISDEKLIAIRAVMNEVKTVV